VSLGPPAPDLLFRNDGPLSRREVGRQIVALFLGGLRPEVAALF
jgi:hypothetical protein